MACYCVQELQLHLPEVRMFASHFYSFALTGLCAGPAIYNGP